MTVDEYVAVNLAEAPPLTEQQIETAARILAAVRREARQGGGNGLLPPAEVAERLRMSPHFVHDELRRRNHRGIKVGGAWRIRSEDVDAYLEARVNVRPVRRRAQPPRRRGKG